MATAAGGTHPTGMHSCTFKKYISFYFSNTFLSLWRTFHIAFELITKNNSGNIDQDFVLYPHIMRGRI